MNDPAPEILGLSQCFDGLNATDRARLAAELFNAAAEWLDAADATGIEYTPHAIDELIFASIKLDGAQTRAMIVAAIEGESYQSRGVEKAATEGTLKRRIAHLSETGLIRSTPSGYVIGDADAVEAMEDIKWGVARKSRYIPHPLDVLVFAALESEGAKHQAELLAALDSDTYKSQGQKRGVAARTLQRRLPELVAMGAIAKTPGGYVVIDTDAVDAADAAFPG